VAFSPDSQLCFAGTRDHVIRIWEVATGREVGAFTGHKQDVCAVAISPDGHTLASASLDGTLRWWSVAARRAVATLRSDIPTRWMEFTPDGRALLTREMRGALSSVTLRIYRAPEPATADVPPASEAVASFGATVQLAGDAPLAGPPHSGESHPPSPAGAASATTLLGWWSGDGHANDLANRGHQGALQGQTTYVPGAQGQAFAFHGSGDCVRIPDPLDGSLDFGLDSFTVAAWVNTACTNTRALVQKKELGVIGDDIHVLGFELFILRGWLGFQWGDGCLGDLNRLPPKSARRINDGSWHHVAVTLDRASPLARGQLYVDGEPYFGFTSRLRGRLNPAADLFIGDHERPFAACLDEVKLFRGAMSPGEIQGLCRARPASPRGP
jgi:hypothetical protein